MFSSVVVVFGRPERSSSPKLLRPRLNSAAQNFTVVNDGAESPYRLQLIFDLRRRIAFRKQIFDDSWILNFVQFHKNTHINSLKRLLHNNCASIVAETLVSNCQQMNNEIP